MDHDEITRAISKYVIPDLSNIVTDYVNTKPLLDKFKDPAKIDKRHSYNTALHNELLQLKPIKDMTAANMGELIEINEHKIAMTPENNKYTALIKDQFTGSYILCFEHDDFSFNMITNITLSVGGINIVIPGKLIPVLYKIYGLKHVTGQIPLPFETVPPLYFSNPIITVQFETKVTNPTIKYNSYKTAKTILDDKIMIPLLTYYFENTTLCKDQAQFSVDLHMYLEVRYIIIYTDAPISHCNLTIGDRYYLYEQKLQTYDDLEGYYFISLDGDDTVNFSYINENTKLNIYMKDKLSEDTNVQIYIMSTNYLMYSKTSQNAYLSEGIRYAN